MDITNHNAAELLHMLGHIYGQQGDTKRGLLLLLVAARLAPDNTSILRTLVHCFLLDGAPEQALAVIERLRSTEDAGDPNLDLLMSRALWACGRHVEARTSFRVFLNRTKQP